MAAEAELRDPSHRAGLQPLRQEFREDDAAPAGEREELGVVADQYGSPTSALDIADGIIAVSRNLLERPDDRSLRGLFHMTGTGFASWSDFAAEIFPSRRSSAAPPRSSSHRVSRLPDAGEAPGQFQARLHEAERGTRCHAPTLAPVP